MFFGIDTSTLYSVLPFLLMLAVVYGALQIGSPFKKDGKPIKGVNFIIAVVLAIFSATYEPALNTINNMLPYAVVLFVVVFLIGFIKSSIDKKTDFTLLAIVAGLVAIFLASSMGSEVFDFLSSVGPLSSENLAAAAALLFVLLIFVAAYKKWSA